jgi:hypothetical protein
MGVHTTYETLLYFGCRRRHWRYDSIRAYILNREAKHDSRLSQQSTSRKRLSIRQMLGISTVKGL